MLSIKKMYKKYNLQSIIVAICILFVCIATQRIQTVKWDTGLIELSRDSLGIWMSIILFTNYKWSDFVKYKRPYVIWSVVGLVLGLIFVPLIIARRESYLIADTVVIALGVYLMVYCVLHTLISFWIEGYRPKFYKPLLTMWVVMMIWMIFSKTDYLWPECYFVLFLCYYMTEQTPSQRGNVIKGLVDGIILSFVCMQGFSLLFRPYDRVRYMGNFCNPNHNCMFLCICLAAILGKILFLTNDKAKFYIKAFYFVLAGVCYSFICMTIGRSGYLTTFVITIIFMIIYSVIKRKNVFVRMGMLLVLLFALLFPATYAAVRYVPTIHPHVIFYFPEGYSEDRVHSWDSRDSEKFVSFEELVQNIFGRFIDLKPVSNDTSSGTQNNMAGKPILLVSNAPTVSIGSALPPAIESEEDPDKIPVLTYEERQNAFLVRYTIYKWYVDHLSLRGMPYDDQGFQLTESQWIQETHSIYLEYGINFGYPAMILFTVFIWWGIGRLVKRGIHERDVKKFACLLIVLVPPIFGLFEYAWGTGMISTVAFYLCFKEMFQVD